MDAQTCILTRRSVRKFTDEPVSRELLEKVVALAAYAPSWKNTQISRYLAIEDPAVQNTIAEEYCLAGANNPNIIKGAPLLVAQTFAKDRCGYNRDGTSPPTGRTAGSTTTAASPPRPSAWPPTTWGWAPSSWGCSTASASRSTWRSPRTRS